MPPVRVAFYQEGDRVPVRDRIDTLSREEQDLCYNRLAKLRAHGYELGFPLAERLGDGIWELRARVRKVRLRMLFFFHEREAAVLTNGFTKKSGRVTSGEIERATSRRKVFRQDPE